MTEASRVDFRRHAVDQGSDDAGRVDFQRMLSALVGVEYPNATEIRPAPGDWGIDVVVGSLVESILIWQVKYFYTSIGPAQQKQIRESFASAMKNAAAEGYIVDAWTLCVACDLSPQERKWWDAKVKEWKKDYPDLAIELWDATMLRRKLMSEDARHVLDSFYSDRRAATAGAPVISVDDTPEYSNALFVKQMSVAGLREHDAQRKAYFNADLLVRDVQSRAVPAQLAAISELDGMLLAGWEDAVADPATTHTAEEYEGSAGRLFRVVMTKSEVVPPPAELPIRPMHGRGLMHRIVDGGRAGWVQDWRDVAKDHAGEEPDG